MILRVRKNAGKEAEDVLEPGAGKSAWGSLFSGSGSPGAPRRRRARPACITARMVAEASCRAVCFSDPAHAGRAVARAAPAAQLLRRMVGSSAPAGGAAA